MLLALGDREGSKVAGTVVWFSGHAGDEGFSCLDRCCLQAVVYGLMSEKFGNLLLASFIGG